METVTATYWVAIYDTGQDADYVLFDNEQDALGWCGEILRAPYVAQWIADGEHIEVVVYRHELPVDVWGQDDWVWWDVQRSAVRVHSVHAPGSGPVIGVEVATEEECRHGGALRFCGELRASGVLS